MHSDAKELKAQNSSSMISYFMPTQLEGTSMPRQSQSLSGTSLEWGQVLPRPRLNNVTSQGCDEPFFAFVSFGGGLFV
jgi:hypothetical protein